MATNIACGDGTSWACNKAYAVTGIELSLFVIFWWEFLIDFLGMVEISIGYGYYGLFFIFSGIYSG